MAWFSQVWSLHIVTYLCTSSHCWGNHTLAVCMIVCSYKTAVVAHHQVQENLASIPQPADHPHHHTSIHDPWGLEWRVCTSDIVSIWQLDNWRAMCALCMNRPQSSQGGSWLDSTSPRFTQRISKRSLFTSLMRLDGKYIWQVICCNPSNSSVGTSQACPSWWRSPGVFCQTSNV